MNIKNTIMNWLGLNETNRRLEYLEKEHEELKDCLVEYVIQLIKVEFVEEGGIMPTKATDGSAAYDLFTPDFVVLKPGRNVIPLGFRMKMPFGVQAMIEPRSGFSAKGFEVEWVFNSGSNETRVDADVIPGKVDSDYTGIVGVIVNNKTGYELRIKKGSRIAQMTFTRVLEAQWTIVPQLSQTQRGDGGFGSTGTK